MRPNTIGIVITENKDVREISRRVLKGINQVKGKYLTRFVTDSNRFLDEVIYKPKDGFFQVRFHDGYKDRTLWVFLDCDSDNLKYGKNSISLSFGDSGTSREIMKKVLDEFKDLGTCYFHESDHTGEPVIYSE